MRTVRIKDVRYYRMEVTDYVDDDIAIDIFCEMSERERAQLEEESEISIEN